MLKGPEMGRNNLSLLFVSLLIFVMVSNSASAQYWYQYGARAGVTSAQNSGAAITIQTITPQKSKSGSLGYWVGENLDNGAFLQVGYVVENVSGMYPALCDLASCRNYEQLSAGDTQWFYEYFPSGYNGGFLGALGPDNSVGANGTSHTYAFYASSGKWYFTLDGKILGNVSLGSSTSGPSMPVAFGEVANTTGVSSPVPQIIFSNFSFYRSGVFKAVQQGLAYIGYGVGSKTDMRNPYGVQELGNRINYFAIGSGLAQPINNTILWNLGYTLSINSNYANLSGRTNYVAYSSVKLSAPQTVQLNATARMMFTGWQGVGLGSYTGAANSVLVTMSGNVTETALWQKQYYFNASSAYGTTFGSGWYYNGSAVSYGLKSNVTQTSATSRQVFAGWSNGNGAVNGTLVLTKPGAASASWNVQYLVSVQSQYGSVAGSGWYNNNSVAQISISSNTMVTNVSTKLGFYQWSNGNKNKSFSITVGGPLLLSAQFRNLYLTGFAAQNSNGAQLSNVTLYIGNQTITNNSYFYSAVPYQISFAYYKGVKMAISSNFTVSSAGTVAVTLPVYQVNIASRDIFGMPVNSLVTLSFSNSSRVEQYTGSSGAIAFNNVPYGYASGTASYLGISQGINVRSGAGSGITFVSLFDFGVFAGVALVIAIAYFLAKRRYGGNRLEGEMSQAT
ncbi:MAG: hypothetical protein KGH53_00725 [Candidatus Micrarchaeota archaeon]|nr:hypothetical protein [Candidatus Micrarchaeota archaeon]